MIARNSEELIRLAACYGRWSDETIKNIIAKYEVIDIRHPKKGECFVTTTGQVALVEFGFSGPPVLIVKKRPVIINGNMSCVVKVSDVYSDLVQIPEGYEFVDFRFPKLNELFLCVNKINQNRIVKCVIPEYRSLHIILRKVS